MNKLSNNFVKIITIIFLFIVLFQPINALDNKSKLGISFVDDKANVSISFIDKANISSNELKKINKTDINNVIVDKDYDYKLIYKKNTIMNNILAQTGSNYLIYIILGASSLLLFIFLFTNKKNNSKKNKFLVPIIIIGGSIFINQINTNADKTFIKDKINFNIQRGHTFKYNPDKIKNYSYVGYLVSSSDE
ncbi:MAG: LPXTG cell wall anchor domain-containing protein [Erysipelotrichales bacterium]